MNVSGREMKGVREDSLDVFEVDENRAANTEGQVDKRAEQRQTEVISDANMDTPAFLDLLQPEQQLPHHDTRHGQADDELYEEDGRGHVPAFFLPMTLLLLLGKSRETSPLRRTGSESSKEWLMWQRHACRIAIGGLNASAYC